MIRNEVIIGVEDVERSSKWDQALLNWHGNHRGPTFEVLTDDDDHVFLCLHKWGDHDHPTLTNPENHPGNGLILYLRVENLDLIWRNAGVLNAVIEKKPCLNENSGKEEFAIRDLDNYY